MDWCIIEVGEMSETCRETGGIQRIIEIQGK